MKTSRQKNQPEAATHPQLTQLTTPMRTTKKKMSMQSDSKIITEVITTEAEIITTEEIEVELHTSTLTQTEEDNKPHNTGATQAGAETQIEETEEAALKAAVLNNTRNHKTT